MVRIALLPFANVRRVLLALLAIALVLRLGGTCEAMAATFVPSVEHSACAGMPMKDHAPAKPAPVDCALCAALPGHVAAPSASIPFTAIAPTSGVTSERAGLSGAPAPPPPRIV